MVEQIIFWLVLLIVLLGIEMATLGLTTIWFAGGALIAVVAALLHAPLTVQIVLFFLVSLVLVFFTRPVAVKYFNKDRVRTNVESVLGKQTIVTEEIDNLLGKGGAVLNGQEWSARSTEDGKIIPEGAVVTIEAVSGVKLIVKAAFAEQEKAAETSD